MAVIRYGNHSVIGFGSMGNPSIYFCETSAGIKDWRTGKGSDGRIVLYEYLGEYSALEPLKVPDKYGFTTINDYRLGWTTTASNTPFYNNPNVVSVDLKNVPFKNNSMYRAFYNCRNLTSVNGINKNVTNMANTFSNCSNLNQNIQIPNSVTNMYRTFYHCQNLNQNIQIPNSVTEMYGTFYSCYNLNQNIQIPSSVKDMSHTFSGCDNLNQNIQIPNSVTDMSHTFYFCYNLNQSIQIPNSVTDMSYTFYGCLNLSSRINILSQNVTDASSCFSEGPLPKDVYIPYTYDNGAYTKTYNAFKSAGYFVGVEGVTMHDLNATSGDTDHPVVAD